MNDLDEFEIYFKIILDPSFIYRIYVFFNDITGRQLKKIFQDVIEQQKVICNT